MASIEPVFAVGPGSGSEFQASGALFRLGGTIRNRLLLGSLWGSLWQLDESVVCFFCVFVSVHTYDIQVLFKLFKCQIRSKISLFRRERIRVVVCVFVALTVSVSAGKRMLGCSVSLHDFAEWTEAYRQRCMCQCQATWTST